MEGKDSFPKFNKKSGRTIEEEINDDRGGGVKKKTALE